MSLRLLRWLSGREPAPGDLASAAEHYASEGAFADWARMTLLGGDEVARLSSAFGALTAAVRARRERFNRRFAELLVTWNTGGGADPRLVPVEDALGSVLSPLAAQGPALLLVADGMSLAVFRPWRRA